MGGLERGLPDLPRPFLERRLEQRCLALESDEINFNPVWTGPKSFVSPSWDAPPSPLLCCQPYYGGDLQGILDRLDQLTAEGVTARYLNPIDAAGSAHGYDANDYLKAAPHLGVMAALKRPPAAAHPRGMHVIVDFVPNHTGLGSWAFREVVKTGRNSPHWNWTFIKRWSFEPGDASADVPAIGRRYLVRRRWRCHGHRSRCTARWWPRRRHLTRTVTQ